MSDSLWLYGLWPIRLLCPCGFSRQEYRSGLPHPPLGDLPNPGIKFRSPALQAVSLPPEQPGKPKNTGIGYYVMSAMSNSVKPYGLQPVRLLCLWDSPGKNTGVGYHALLQGIFLTQGSNPRLLHLPALAGGFFTTSATCEAQFYSEIVFISIITTDSPIRASFLLYFFFCISFKNNTSILPFYY